MSQGICPDFFIFGFLLVPIDLESEFVMRLFTRLLAFLLLTALLGLSFASCGNSSSEEPGTPSHSETDTNASEPDEPVPEGAFAFATSLREKPFSVVRSDLSSKAIADNLIKVRTHILALYEISDCPPKTDWKEKGETDDDIASYPEILIGKTNRPQSQKAFAELADNEFLIRVDGPKLIIIGKDDRMTTAAVNYLINTVLTESNPPRYLASDFEYRELWETKANYQKISAEGAARPYLIISSFNPEEAIVANVIATEDNKADPTGTVDSTSAIQAALDQCAAQGGGTVFLPSGTYLVTGTVSIPASVTLVGEWSDPDAPGFVDYGTVILAKPTGFRDTETMPKSSSPLFKLTHNSGCIGLTVFYPEQDASNIRRYGFTFNVPGASTATLRNITLINSYRGIGVCPEAEWHELMQLEHIRVCALDIGVEMHVSSDVGYSVDVRVSPSYWANAISGYACANTKALTDQCRNNGTGMILGDLDDETLSEISISGYNTGMLMNTINRDGGFWGVLYDVSITDCNYGLYIETMSSGNPAMFASGVIEGSVIAVKNMTENAPLRLCDIQIKGKTEGYIIQETDDLSSKAITHGTYEMPSSHLYVVPVSGLSRKIKDLGPALQETLNKAAGTGGIVYLPSGIYSMYTPVTIPAGVQLRGSMAIFTRDAAVANGENGTLIMSYIEDGPSFTLKDNSGFSGIRVWYPSLDPTTSLAKLKANDPICSKQTAIKGDGKGCYVLNSVFVSPFTAVDMTNCDNHLVKEVFGCASLYFIRAGGQNGYVEECLANPNFTQRHAGLFRYFDESRSNLTNWETHHQGEDMADPGFALLRDDLLRQYCVTFSIEDAVNENLINGFMYAAKTLVEVRNSTALLLNDTADYLFGQNPMFYVKDSTVFAVNALRIFGISLVNENSTFDICNREDRNCTTERAYHSSIEFEDTGTLVDISNYKTRIDFSDCDSLNGAQNVTLTNDDYDDIMEGEGAWKHVGTGDVILSWKFAPLDITSCAHGYFHLWVYIEDASKMGSGQIELTSSGTCDQEEMNWGFRGLQDGWNELILSLDSAGRTGGTPDRTALNYLRIYASGQTTTFLFDDMYFIAP